MTKCIRLICSQSDGGRADVELLEVLHARHFAAGMTVPDCLKNFADKSVLHLRTAST